MRAEDKTWYFRIPDGPLAGGYMVELVVVFPDDGRYYTVSWGHATEDAAKAHLAELRSMPEAERWRLGETEGKRWGPGYIA